MNFNEFDKEMRVFEQSLDQRVLPDMYMVARLDGYAFSKLTAKKGYQKPFDLNFKELMIKITKTLVEESNMRIIYAYTESDEISLLFAADEMAFNRKTRKLNSLLAALASSSASRQLNDTVLFDCRIIPLPSKERVIDYFAWRQEDAARNALNGYCYWIARRQDHMSKHTATNVMLKKDNAWKHDYLYQHFIIFLR